MSKNYNGITYDSEEEVEIRMWLDEALEYKLIDRFIYKPDPYIIIPKQLYVKETKLKTKIKLEEKTVFQEHKYTSDFRVLINKKKLPFKGIPNKLGLDYFFEIDVKGTFQMYDGARSFSINRKLVYEKFGIYIHKIIPKKLFKETWCPEGARYSPVQKKPRKCYEGFLNIEQFLTSKVVLL